MNVDFNEMFGTTGTEETVQESYDAASSSYSDLFGAKFDSFNPETIVSQGNNQLKGDGFGLDLGGGELEASDLALGYKNSAPAMTPNPGKFF